MAPKVCVPRAGAGRELITFSDLILGVTQHHFHLHYIVRSKLLQEAKNPTLSLVAGVSKSLQTCFKTITGKSPERVAMWREGW